MNVDPRFLPLLSCLSFACASDLSTVVKRHEAGRGVIAGSIVDAGTGKRVAGAYVLAVLRSPKPMTAGALTGPDGDFELPELSPDTYELQVEKKGYRTASTPNLTVTSNEEVRISVKLHAGEANEGNPLTTEHLIEPPVKLSGPDPHYTAAALRHNVHGTMIVRCVITAGGDVRACRVRESLPYMDDSVIEALEARKYRPARRDGQPLDVNYTFKINLALP